MIIMIPQYINRTVCVGNIQTEEEKRERENKRLKILHTLQNNPDGLTLQEIANAANKDVRAANGILTVLIKQGKVERLFLSNKALYKHIAN